MQQRPANATSARTNVAVQYAAANYAERPQSTAETDREALIEAHLPQVKYIADRLAAKLPPSIDRDDLIGAGVLGLLDAIDKYDPSRGVLFKTYAEMRVRGAMLDSLRDLDWVPRSVRRRARQVEATYREIEQEQGRSATEEEVATRLGISVREFHGLLAEMNGLTVTGLEYGDDGEVSNQTRQVSDDSARTPVALFERTELKERLAELVDKLPKRERQVIALYYLEELTMKEIGAVLGVTESRVSQIHTQASLRLRAALQPLLDADAIDY